MPRCAVCDRPAPKARHVEDVGLVCPASRDTQCYEQAREIADEKWRNLTIEQEVAR